MYPRQNFQLPPQQQQLYQPPQQQLLQQQQQQQLQAQQLREILQISQNDTRLHLIKLLDSQLKLDKLLDEYRHTPSLILEDKGHKLETLKCQNRQLLHQVRFGKLKSKKLFAQYQELSLSPPIGPNQQALEESTEEREAQKNQCRLHQRFWNLVLKDEFEKPYHQWLLSHMQQLYLNDAVLPPEEEVFNWMHHCYVENVKVVILGQDPYPQAYRANGLAFSINRSQKVLPKSLNIIYKALEYDLKKDFQRPEHGDLTEWAKQGVLLLNSILTVRLGKPKSHSGIGWEVFTNAVINIISEKAPHVVFMLWGEEAKKKAEHIEGLREDKCCTISRPNIKNYDKYVDAWFDQEQRKIRTSEKRHLILSTSHPSSRRSSRRFIKCNHFSLANLWLKWKIGGDIDWNVL